MVRQPSITPMEASQMLIVLMPQKMDTVAKQERSYRRVRVPKIASLLAFILISFMAGCNRNPAGTTGQINIGETSCVYCAIGNTAELALVVWVDDPDRVPARGIGGDPPYHGEFRLKGGGKLTWNCSSRDGKTGNVEIAGLPYDLEKGGLFLVSTKEGGSKVEQLPIETVGGTIQSANEKLESLAKTDPRITAFVNAAKGK
jgi:hypothetical protein